MTRKSTPWSLTPTSSSKVFSTMLWIDVGFSELSPGSSYFHHPVWLPTDPYADRPTNRLRHPGRVRWPSSVEAQPHAAPFQAGGRHRANGSPRHLPPQRSRAAALRAQRTGHGEHIDCSIAEAMTIAASGTQKSPDSSSATSHSQGWRGAWRRHPWSRRLDGYVGFCTNSREQFDRFPRPHRASRTCSRPASSRPLLARQSRWDEWTAIVRAWTTARSTAEIVTAASELRIPGRSRSMMPAGLLGFEHFMARQCVSSATRPGSS